VVDMSAAAVTDRLLTMARLLRARGFVHKGVGMSPAEVTGRLRVMAELSSMCQRLGLASLQGPIESSQRIIT
jgi:hypothetical protein